MKQTVTALARTLYPDSKAEQFLNGLEKLDDEFKDFIRAYRPPAHTAVLREAAGASGHADSTQTTPLFDQNDLLLITYGDQFRGDGVDDPVSPLAYLNKFLRDDLSGEASGVHILPFCPYSSDEGFSVIDYLQINPDLGDWRDVDAIASDYTLMADLVCNHCSVKHDWFQRFLRNEAPYNEYFITQSPNSDVSGVFRPRTSPLLHPFETASGTKHVWTTFSADQVDLNYASPHLFLEIVKILFTYILHGARMIRLDAVAYLWKELGTPSIHHPLTHIAIQLMRALVDERFPGVLLITETNVPHQDNISYFGDGDNEAHLVYNFSLPPLTLDAMIRGDARHLTKWASTLQPPSAQCTFFNFLASHDGIGVLPANAYLSESDMKNLIDTVGARGGRVSYKQTADGAVPYELNINYLSAVTDQQWPIAKKAAVFLTSQAIMCSLAGVAAPYIQSIIGSENWDDGPAQGLENRSINREKHHYHALQGEFQNRETLRYAIFNGYKRLLRVRCTHPALHPHARQQILDLDPRLFVVQRGAFQTVRQTDDIGLLCLHNSSADTVRVSLPPITSPASSRLAARTHYTDLLSGETMPINSDGTVTIPPHHSLWLE